MRGPGGARIIALLTDFGTRDWYAAALKGVILSRAPEARLVDVTHDIPPQDVVAGAFTLAAAAPWFPEGTIFLAVVDPGVGGRRALVAVRADGRYFVGPDNGLLTLSLQGAKRMTIVELRNQRYWLRAISQTFHGRDIMAPVAAYLATGRSLSRLGPRRTRLSQLPLPGARRHRSGIGGRILHIDTFGNLITNLPGRWLRPGGRRGSARIVFKRRKVRVVSSYGAGRPGELLALEGSLGWVELAIRETSAARAVGAQRGDPVAIRFG